MASTAVRSPSVEEAYRYCQALTRARAKNFYYAFLPLPRDQRRAIYAAYAFSRFSDDYSDEALEKGSKADLLTEHRRRLHEAYAGRPTGPVFTALAAAAIRYSIPQEYFDSLIDGVLMDLEVARYQTFDDLKKYCYLVASVVGLICIQIFGYSDPRAKDYAIDMGIAMQLVNIMRDVKEDAERGRIYVPLEDLKRFAYTEEDVMKGVVDERFQALMKFEGDRARQYFRNGARLLPMVPRRSRVCPATLRGLYSAVLRKIEDRRYDVFSARVGLTTRQKLWLVTRTWTGTTVRGLLPFQASSS